jgi:hypothetical protein
MWRPWEGLEMHTNVIRKIRSEGNSEDMDVDGMMMMMMMIMTIIIIIIIIIII